MHGKIKVLHICETIKGGQASYLAAFETLCGDRCDSVFVVPENHADQLPPALRCATFTRRKRGLRAIAAMLRAALVAARHHRPDLVVCHSTFTLAALPLLRLLCPGTAFVYIPHGWARLRYADQSAKARVTELVEGTLAGLAHVVLNISLNDKHLAESRAYRGHHLVVENALPDQPSSPSSPPFPAVAGRIDLVFVGRIDRQKGLDILLPAFAQAVRANPALHLHVVGAPVCEGGAGIEADLAAVTFHGWTEPAQVARFFAHADLTVMASRWEGLPMVLIESLRAGTPVLLADTCGQGELVAGSGGGLALPLDAEAFARTLSGLDAATLATMRGPARAHYLARFSGARFRRETLAALDIALARVRRPRMVPLVTRAEHPERALWLRP